MNTTLPLRRLDVIRVWAGLLAILCVVSLEFWMLWRFGNYCLQAMTYQGSNMPWAEVQLAFR